MRTFLLYVLFLLLTKQVLASLWLLPHSRFILIPLKGHWITTNRIDSGLAQSPIDLSRFTIAKCPDVKYQINYGSDSTVRVTNTIQTSKLCVH
jgi:hypothetical protein